ncbi:MAG: class I poly(R)-hydroxyalkanoic acid synthase, partial [Alphaproteobacteria bacterium HGW-Alphaproteobacteria-16]
QGLMTACMPARVHHFYLDNFYNANRLAKGAMVLAGETLDLGKIAVPAYHVATKEDHIAPPQSVYRGATMLGSKDSTFILAGSGHIAGVVNPPAAGKYQYWTNMSDCSSLEQFVAGATQTPGSWWPDWIDWIGGQEGDRIEAKGARIPKGNQDLGDAPGTYVRTR